MTRECPACGNDGNWEIEMSPGMVLKTLPNGLVKVELTDAVDYDKRGIVTEQFAQPKQLVKRRK